MVRCLQRPHAVARLKGGPEAPHICGEVRFYQERGTVLVVADISALPTCGGSGFFGLHIHEGGACHGENFAQTGSHYEPQETVHPEHAGDLPPLMRCGNRAFLAVRTDRFCVQEIIGRTVVIHEHADDFRSQPSGNAGAKIACGVICKNR